MLGGMGWDGWDGWDMGGNGRNDTTHTHVRMDMRRRLDTTDGKGGLDTYSLHIYAHAGRMDEMGWMVGVFSGALHFTGTR